MLETELNPLDAERRDAPSAASRREFLLSLGAVAVCSVPVAACGPLPGEFHEIHRENQAQPVAEPDSTVVADAATVTDAGGEIAPPKVLLAFDLKDKAYDALATIGGMVPVQVGATKCVLIRSATDTILALGRICPHTNCDMSPDDFGLWNEAKKSLVCLCHGSMFSSVGKVTKGPAKTSVASFPVSFDGQSGVVTE